MSTTHVSKNTIDRETDARFWAQTHYKIGQKLDPHDKIDSKMIPLWLDIWSKVKREDAEGRLVLTYNHPVVERNLDDAAIASHAADGHLEAAVAEPDPAIAAQHASAAAQAATAAADAARRASSAQPPTVSPIVADAAAAGVAASAGLPSPAPITSSLPPGHPATSSPAAHPIIPPGVATATATKDARTPPWMQDPFAIFSNPPATAAPSANARPQHGHHGGHHDHRDRPASEMTPRHQIAAAQAISAPAVAAQVHEDAHAQAAGGQPPPSGSAHPRATGSVRELAARLANQARSGFVGVDFSSDGQWSAPEFGSADEARAWYERAAEHPDRHRYLAHFDRGSGSDPVDEVFGSSEAHGDGEVAPPRADDADARSSSNVPMIAAAAGIGLIALALLAGRGGGNGGGRGRTYP